MLIRRNSYNAWHATQGNAHSQMRKLTVDPPTNLEEEVAPVLTQVLAHRGTHEM